MIPLDRRRDTLAERSEAAFSNRRLEIPIGHNFSFIQIILRSCRGGGQDNARDTDVNITVGVHTHNQT